MWKSIENKRNMNKKLTKFETFLNIVIHKNKQTTIYFDIITYY